jgi:DNA-directed RNA polymerase subunit M/transcription elongation factor TFIIS
MDNYCEVCLGLREEITSGAKLQFKCNKCGEIYDAKPEQTLLVSEEIGAADSISKYKNSIRVTAHDPSNPRMEHPCEKCGSKVTSYQRLGEKKKLVIVCECGNIMK